MYLSGKRHRLTRRRLARGIRAHLFRGLRPNRYRFRRR